MCNIPSCNVHEGNIIYWAIKGYSGSDDVDAAKFIERVKTLHIAQMPDSDESTSVEPHSIEAPFEGTNATIDMLKKKLYEDFQCFDASAVSAGNQTATAIKASYAPLDLQTDKFEAEVTRFLMEILRLAGIDDKPSYTRNQIINKTEETQVLLLGAQYYDEEYMAKKLLTINGDIDQYEEMMKRKAAEEVDRSFVEDEDAPPAINDAIEDAEQAAGKQLNGAQTQSLIQVISQLAAGAITEGQAINIIATAIGVSKEEARAIIAGE